MVKAWDSDGKVCIVLGALVARRSAPGETTEKKRFTDGRSGLWTDEAIINLGIW